MPTLPTVERLTIELACQAVPFVEVTGLADGPHADRPARSGGRKPDGWPYPRLRIPPAPKRRWCG
jgi:hypothetical protein